MPHHLVPFLTSSLKIAAAQEPAPPSSCPTVILASQSLKLPVRALAMAWYSAAEVTLTWATELKAVTVIFNSGANFIAVHMPKLDPSYMTTPGHPVVLLYACTIVPCA